MTCAGHSFCRGCLVRALEHKANCCPTCFTVLHTSAQNHPTSTHLQAVLSEHFAEQTAERAREVDEVFKTPPQSASLPLFITDYVLPGQAVALNIFEPRYRLMVRRCLDGDRRFGMLGAPDPHAWRAGRSIGSEVEIKDSRQLHDGRFHIQVTVLRRFLIHESSETDGYQVARVSFINDDPQGHTGDGSDPSVQKDPLFAMPEGDLAKHMQMVVKEWLVRRPFARSLSLFAQLMECLHVCRFVRARWRRARRRWPPSSGSS